LDALKAVKSNVPGLSGLGRLPPLGLGGLMALVVLGALALLIKGGSWFPSATPGGGHTGADLLVAGAQAYAAKDWAQCVSYYSQAISAAPSSSAAFAGRGKCEFGGGDFQSSVNDLSRAISLNGNGPSAPLLFARATAYDALGNDDAAAADYLKIVTASQSIPSDVATAVDGLRIANHVPAAVAAGLSAVNRYPGAWQVHDQLALSEDAVGSVSTATAEFTKALALASDAPSKARVLHDRSELEQTQGALAGGFADVSQAIALDPRWEYYRTRAEIREGLDDLSGALVDLTQAVRVDESTYPDDTTVRVWLLDERGRLQLTMGLKSGASRDFAAALPLTSDPVARATLSNELAKAR
jgi:tetratricopeptide (TPR) repeat protein